MRLSRFVTILVFSLFMPLQAGLAATPQEMADAFYYASDHDARAAAFSALEAGQADPAVRFTLGSAQFFNAVEGFIVGLMRYGLAQPLPDDAGAMIGLQLPQTGADQHYEEIDYPKFVGLLDGLSSGFATSIATLSAIPADADFGIVVNLDRVSIDLGAPGPFPEGLTFGSILSLGEAMSGNGEGKALEFRFDRADAYWLEGYAHFLSADLEFVLAHDFERLFDLSFTMFFPYSMPDRQLMIPPPAEPGGGIFDFNAGRWWQGADIISFLHLADLKVISPARRASARTHLLAMIDLSRKSWDSVFAERDDDREWLPGPKQDGIHPLFDEKVTKKQVIAWLGALDVGEKVLNGELLLPHWRFPGKGINLKKLLEGTENFDPILLLTGPGAVPYLETGAVLDTEKWDDGISTFGPLGFLGTAFRFN